MLMRVGITGGLGFIGSNLAKKILGLNIDVTIIDDLSSGKRENLDGYKFRYIPGSIMDDDSVEDFFEGLDFVYHLAARGSVPRSFANQKLTYEANLVGSIAILEAARVNSIPLVLVSSSSVFGSSNLSARSEADLKNPISPYAVSKLAMEMASTVNRKIFSQQCTVVRLFNVFGPLQRGDHDYAAVIPRWINSALNKKPLHLFGDGSNSRDFTYVGDVVDILTAFLFNRSLFKYPEVNIGFGRQIELNNIIVILRKNFDELIVQNFPERVGDISKSSNNAALFNSLFNNFQPKQIEEAVEETINWFKAQNF